MLFYSLRPYRSGAAEGGGKAKMNENDDIPEARGGIPMSSGSLSVYRHGGDALDDFPVLKAFQQYVDAEQAKAHKRLMTVCVFFTMLILAVTGVFLFIIFEMNRKAANEDPTLKALSDSNAALQKQILDQTVKMNERFMSQISSERDRPVSAADAELQRRNLELQAKLNALEIENRLRAERAAEDEKRRREEAAKPKPAAASDMSKEEQTAKLLQFKKAAAAIHEREEALRKKEESLKAREAKAAAEAERLKQKEKQLHRQSLYPEYFDQDGNELPHPVRRRPAAAQTAPAAQPTPERRAAPAAVKPSPAAAPAPKARPAPAAKERDDIDELDDILPPLELEENDEVKVDQKDEGKVEGTGKGKEKPPATPKPATTPKPAPKAKPTVSPNDIIAPQKKPPAATRESMQLDVNGANSAWTIPLE